MAREDESLAAIGARPQSHAYSGVEALAAGLLRRRRPPREPRLVFFFGFGASSPAPFSPAPFSDGALSEGALSAVTAGSGSSGLDLFFISLGDQVSGWQRGESVDAV